MSEKYFTLEDVAKNNGVGEARTWMIIKDVIYDLTDYLSEHPGGSELLSEYAGKDGTAAFEDFGHSSDAKSILKSYRIGQLALESRSAKKVKKGSNPKTVTDSTVEPEEAQKNRRSFLRIVCGGCV